jgi:NADH-quinone oxidoreductase subunit N
LSSGLLLYGCSLIYGFTGSTNFQSIAQNFNSNNLGLIFGIVFIIVGLGFKISVVPFHMWTPDVYEGSPTSVTVFFALVPKIAAMTVFIRFTNVAFSNIFDQWQLILIFLSVGSMILGAVAAIGQENIKRLMAYSSIGHMGYALAGILTGTIEGTKSTIIYLTIYAVMNVGIFACIFFMKRREKYVEDIKDLSGLSKTNPLLAVGFLIMLFSLAGIPPLAGFFAKFYIFVAVLDSKLYLLAVIGLVTTVISSFYYLRIVKIIYFDESKISFQNIKNFPLKFVLLTSSLIILLYFVYPSILIDMTSSISLG